MLVLKYKILEKNNKKSTKTKLIILIIELIKFKETRNYVQRVLENYNVYRYILEQKLIPMKDFSNLKLYTKKLYLQ